MALIEHWKCDDNAASTAVVATVGTNGTLNGGDNTSVKSVAGPGGSITLGLDLNGTDDRIDIQASARSFAIGDAFSVSMWVKAKGLNVRFIGAGTSTGDRIATALDNDTIIRIVNTGGSSFNFTFPALGTAAWHHVLLTRTTGNSVRVFVDGTESSTGALPVSTAQTFNYIGFNGNGYSNGFSVAQIKIFDSDESANVATLFAEGSGGGDVTPPALSSPATNVAGTEITATLSESGCVADGGGTTGTGGFTLAGTSATVASWAISGTTLTLTLTGTVENGETVTYSYARASTTDDIKDAAGNYLADFSTVAVTNNVPGASLAAGTASFVSSGPDGISVIATDATGGTSPYTYQWERNSDGGGYSDLTGETALACDDATATTPGVLYGYRCKQTDDVAAVVATNAVTAQVYSGGTLTGGASSIFQSSVIRGA